MTVTIRDRLRRPSPTASCGPTSRPTAGSSRRRPAAPSAAGEPIGAAVAATVELAPGERRSLRFAVAWDLPVVEFGAGRRWWKRYTRTWGRTGERAFDLAAPRARARRRAGARRSRPGRRPILDDPTSGPTGTRRRSSTSSTSWSTAARFWEAGEVDGPEPDPDDPGRFALLECLDYPFYDSVDVDFYASFAVLRLYPGARGARHPRPARRDRRSTTRRSSRIEASGAERGPQGRRDRAPRRRRAGRRPVLPAEPLRLPGRQRLEGPRPEVRAAGLARRGRRGPDGDALDPRRLADGGRRARPTSRRATATATACPSTTACPTRPTTPGRCTGRRRTAARSGSGRWRPPRRWPRGWATATRGRRWAGWFERGQVAFDRRLWRGDHYAYDDGGGAELATASWPTSSPASGTPTRPGSATCCRRDRVETALRTIHRLNVCGFAGGRMGAVNGMRPDGTVDATRASSRPRCGSGRPTPSPRS